MRPRITIALATALLVPLFAAAAPATTPSTRFNCDRACLAKVAESLPRFGFDAGRFEGMQVLRTRRA